MEPASTCHRAPDLSLPPAETTAHTWVQMADGATWVDLDPTLAGRDSRVPR